MKQSCLCGQSIAILTYGQSHVAEAGQLDGRSISRTPDIRTILKANAPGTPMESTIKWIKRVYQGNSSSDRF